MTSLPYLSLTCNWLITRYFSRRERFCVLLLWACLSWGCKGLDLKHQICRGTLVFINRLKLTLNIFLKKKNREDGLAETGRKISARALRFLTLVRDNN